MNASVIRILRSLWIFTVTSRRLSKRKQRMFWVPPSSATPDLTSGLVEELVERVA